MSITIAIKPKYPTRKAIDKVLVNEGNFVDFIEVSSVRQLQSLFATSYVAIVSEDKYYPITLENSEEQYDIAKEGSAPTVEVKEDFGFKKLNNFFTSDQVECYNGILKGDVKFVDGKYAVKLSFDTDGATSAGYSEIKINGVDAIAENTLEFKSANALISAVINVTAKLTQGEITEDCEFTFDNKLNPVVLNVENSTKLEDAPAIELDGVAYETFDQAFTKAALIGGTITVNKSVEATLSKYVIDNGRTVIINLNNANITITNTNYIDIKNGIIEFYGTGTVTGNKQYVVQITGTGSVLVGKNVSLIGPKWAAVTTAASATNSAVVSHGVLEGLYYGYASNGTSVGNIFACDGVCRSTSDESEEPVGAYLAGDGEYSFINATVETAGSGIEIRAGKLTIKGGTITSTCTQEPSMHKAGSGTCSVASGIAISQHSTKKKITVDVSDVTVTAKAAIFEGNPSGYETATEDTTININSGTFLGKVMTLDKDKDCKHFLKGGRYSEEPDAIYIAKGYKAVKTSMGTFDVVKE